MWSCKYCNNDFDFHTTSEKANHSRWCPKNSKRNNTENLKIAQTKNLIRKFGEYKDFSVICDRCGKDFSVNEREKSFPSKKRYYCSKSCSQYRGSGLEWAALRNIELVETYRTICFSHHKKKCVICDEENIIAVHHLDENKSNNNPSNLIPLCPTHHQYWHSSFKYLIESKVRDYIRNWNQK